MANFFANYLQCLLLWLSICLFLKLAVFWLFHSFVCLHVVVVVVVANDSSKGIEATNKERTRSETESNLARIVHWVNLTFTPASCKTPSWGSHQVHKLAYLVCLEQKLEWSAMGQCAFQRSKVAGKGGRDEARRETKKSGKLWRKQISFGRASSEGRICSASMEKSRNVSSKTFNVFN